MEAQNNFTIAEFCDLVRISKGAYFKLKKLGLGPDELHIGRRVIITPAARAAWEAKMTSRQSEAEAA
ncbi:hypothetical protein [Paraburkholderia sp. J11-2]|uniref:hypothetical protein n=1 Tax=Paraburkholderia sp. J11-2 TaxID=2805431 RepID=UPI002AB7CB6C|nr:hypothetical protein [Paraburkholderia sp. J11-2]